jgi:hypothetical protein
MEKCDVGWGDFFEFLELFFNIEKGDVAWGDFLILRIIFQ